MKSLIIIRLDYYLTSLLTKIATVTRTSQATAPQSTGLPYKSVRRLICAYLQGPQFLSLEPKPRLIWWIYNILTWCFCLAQLHETRDRPCPRPKLMIQTQQQAIKPNKTSTRQNLKRVRHLWLQTKNQISTLRINSDGNSVIITTGIVLKARANFRSKHSYHPFASYHSSLSN